MFCVECGKDGPVFREGVCLDCYLKTHSFTKGSEFIDMPICSHCNSYKYKNTWTSELFGDVLKRIIKKTFNISRELKKIDINTECKEEKERINCKVYISGFIDDVEITEEHKTIVRLKKTVCDVCSKRFGGYHEAIVQIRVDKRDLSQKEINEIISNVEIHVENLRGKGNRSLFITDIGTEHGGVDFYLSDKGSALTVINKIHDKFGGEMKKSSKNIGMKDSKQVYRSTYLLRLPAFRKGDFISYKNSYFYISSISKNKIHVFDLSTWNDQVLDSRQIKNVHILGGDELIKEMILVNQKENEVQLMDEKTYKIKIVKKPKQINFKSEKIKIITIEDQIFIFPTNA
jgi:nonsense-mediated mRNA decay protein 3